MSVYGYIGRDNTGRHKKGYIVAETPKAARIALQGQGILTESIKPASITNAFKTEARARFYGETGMLLSSGFTIEQALNLLIDEAKEGTEAPLLILKSRILSGENLSTAIAATVNHLPGFENAALITAEETGTQGQMLTKLAEFLESDKSIREKVKSALIYPCLVLILAFGLMALMTFVILPKAMAMFPAGAAPKSAALLATVAPVVMALSIISVVCTAVTVAILATQARKGGDAAIRYEKFLLKLPLVKRLLPLLWASRFAGTMGLLLKAGLNPQSAVSPSGSATGSELITKLSNSAADDVVNGLPLSKAISFITPIAPHLAAWIGVGEKAGTLGEMLSKASDRARAEYEKILTRALSLLEPTLIAAVGAIVLLLALAVIRPMLDLTTKGA